MVGVWVVRNPTKSVAFPNPPRGIAVCSGRETRPRHSRRYELPAHQARGAQPGKSPRDGRAKNRFLCKPDHFGVSGDRRWSDAKTAGKPPRIRVSPTYFALESQVGSLSLGGAVD